MSVLYVQCTSVTSRQIINKNQFDATMIWMRIDDKFDGFFLHSNIAELLDRTHRTNDIFVDDIDRKSQYRGHCICDEHTKITTTSRRRLQKLSFKVCERVLSLTTISCAFIAFKYHFGRSMSYSKSKGFKKKKRRVAWRKSCKRRKVEEKKTIDREFNVDWEKPFIDWM